MSDCTRMCLQGKLRPVILEQLKTITLKWQGCWVREHWLGFQTTHWEVISSPRVKYLFCQLYLRGWFWWAWKSTHKVLCEPHRVGPVGSDNVWGWSINSSSLWFIRNLNRSRSQRSFAPNARFKTNLTCILYSDPLLCIVKCVLLSAAGN